jgi:hypothetical protein
MGLDEGWSEIIGEQLRGGATVAGLDPYAVLGAAQAAMAASPAFKQFVEKRAAASRPMLHQIPLNRARDWTIDFGPVSGAASTTTVVSQNPQCLFRGEKMMATDSGSTAGYGTRIVQVLIGNKLQKSTGGGATLTAFYAPTSLGNGIKWDTCEKGLTIAITVSFVQACTFDGTVFGKAVM